MAAQSGGQRTRDPEELENQVTELMEDVERYRTACEDTLQQLDWCIGYFTGCNKNKLAKALAANRASIRRHLMRRAELAPPTNSEGSTS
jgi:hypothetical protein